MPSGPTVWLAPQLWVQTEDSSYPLLIWVHIADAKVVLLQQAVVVADVVDKKLPFGLPLQRKHIPFSAIAHLIHSHLWQDSCILVLKEVN